MLPLSLVVAYSVPGRVIGREGKLPWHEPEDLKHFKATTSGHAVIMGRKTWDSLGKPLPKRRNLVITRQAGYVANDAEVYADIDSAIAAARTTDPEPCVIGGATIYAQAMPLMTKLVLTEVRMDVTGDAVFPQIDERGWNETERRESGRLVFRTLVRLGS
ncbi:MAG: dihydrofolate reductase, partial [Planctomycetota bacterium]